MERVGATPTAPPGPLATIGRAPALQAGGCGFESRMVHGCSRKRCSYIAARCPPGLPSFIDRWLSWLERLVYTQKVIGSSPVRSTGGVASELCQFCPHVFVGARRESINHIVGPPCGVGWREAHLAELADALDLGSSAFGRVGSSPTMRTIVTDDPPIPGGVRLPGVARDSAPPWFRSWAFGELKGLKAFSATGTLKGPTSQRRRPPILFSSFSGRGPSVMPGGVFLQPNASGAVSRSKMGCELL